ncbi:Zinc finger, RING-type,R3H domain,Zinc finger, NF-X1-type,Transcriptional repressor NF-X1, R3H domain [Cinara cedri]|uniref:Zinc finger, RING-type,R3H domain,Zinc finger, NF-X1-type,Transcriptional repressor NF-X1, R3H domain n=1 Tax=Cinara cedri TaxID=506608 RepID=A0A5E4NHP3_9HEMI|nr:Zinc finger, RING-type,R3H domain,Zinc finger, NF-X1-type,Transcriptional repressor NF-X1, R3H domain [Cinara cedri]
MPRTSSRKRNNHRNAIATALRLPTDSNLSANAPEFIPLSQHNIVNNDNIANQRDNSAIQPMALDGCSSEPNSSGNDNNSEATKSICSLPNANANKGQRDLLINLLNTSKVDCVICYELTKNVEPIWNCRNCFQIMHLKCVMVWFIKSHRHASWRCPACQNEVFGKPNYLCFCGSLPNPFANNVDTPHSCGQVCGLQKKNAYEEYDDCHHKCTLLCHPGPCPRCVVQVLRKCGCGKTQSYAQCGQSSPILCKNKCFKTLKCNNHVCQKQCHSDECGPCDKHCQQVCYCGQSQRQVRCTQENALVVYYNCEKLCNKKLVCGNHSCQKSCHSGECEPCIALDIKYCPCGKRTLTQDELANRTLCTLPIPTCDEICGKPLECGPPESPHICEKKCHEGPCARCELKTKYVCKCGNKSKEIKCNSVTNELTCKRKCNKTMSCGKHRCIVMCCNAPSHECNRFCNGLLNCRQHRCDRICHPGSCAVCVEASFEDLYCRCGNSSIAPPVRCGTRRPLCILPCSREHECDHPATHICHDEEECPPCIYLTEKLCYGGHELRFAIPCHIKNVSCGMPCGYPLPCKRHTCVKPCHPLPCNTGPCNLPCELLKPDCGHPCSKPCHDGPCPQRACKTMVNVSCICGNLTEARLCSDTKVIEYRLNLKTQSMSLLDNIIDSPPTIKSYKILECTTECAKLERNRRIALALQIRNPDLSPNVTPRYSDFMKEFAKKDPPFCNYVHEKLAELVTNAKQSKQNSRSHSFEVMKYEKRKLVHEYCEHFGCESVAYDAEPHRNVVAVALKEKSWLPNYSVVEVLQRENGCPRVNPFASIKNRNTIILNKKL